MDAVDPAGDRAMSRGLTIAHGLRRAALYRLCASALAYPVPGRLAEVAGLAERMVSTLDGTLRDAVQRLGAAARAEHDVTVAGEYVRLFDRAPRCAPCEGAYGPPQMAGKAAQLADIAGFYAAFGVSPSEGQADTEDHVAAELEFMSLLALKEAWARAEAHHEHAEISRDAAVAFLSDHLARWAPLFAGALAGATDLAYYRAVAGLLAAWLAADTAALGVQAEPLVRASADADDAGAFSCPMAPSD
jgi:putative dimethyl sulfoxide reductase chaperone